MEWILGLVAVIAVPVWIVAYWIPCCDKKGIAKAKRVRTTHSPWL
jgi:hypothetical protein